MQYAIGSQVQWLYSKTFSIGSHIKMFKSHISRGIRHKQAPLKNSILENVIFLGAADRA